jgi:hypothetical protein
MAQNLIAMSRMGITTRPSPLQDPLREPTRKGSYTVTGAQPSTVEWRMDREYRKKRTARVCVHVA